jgi:hypothetical protein
MGEDNGSWADYSRLVLKELERLNENYDKMRVDMDSRFSELNRRITEIGTMEHKVNNSSNWIERVNDVWSPSQMKSAKDEIYTQKNKWTATIAIIGFVQIMFGVALGLLAYLKK